MSANLTPVRRDPGYTGLTKVNQTLPSHYYFDADHYQYELKKIWQRNWVYTCRSSAVAAARSYRTFQIGDQSVVVVRGEDGSARAFHNTCRHRGAALCRDTEGRFGATGIVCPYHSWRYNLRGELVQTSSVQTPDGFSKADYPLFQLPLREWGGFIFVCLAAVPPPFEKAFDLPLERFAPYELDRLEVGHTLRKTIKCNWKVFWENYNECLHCPGVHPKLAQLVPIFGRALLERKDDPSWQDHAADEDPKYAGGLRRGAQSWTMDGQPVGVEFPKVSDEDRKAGHLYLTSVPSVFIVTHVDYVRVVRLLPLGPELTEMSIEFLFLPQTLAEKRDISGAVEFTNIVMSEDAEVSELNQRGLRATAFESGVLMPEEYAIRQFQDWVRAELARP